MRAGHASGQPWSSKSDSMIDDILSRLDLDGIRDFPAELGAFSLESLYVRYSFTQDDYEAALRSLPNADELPDHLKTVVHETTHLFQTTTTPFGMLIRRLRILQGALVVDAIRKVRARGSAVSFPLKNMLRSLPRRLAAEVEEPIRMWYAVELFILIMLGETDVWEEHGRRNPLVQGVSLGELFVLVQYSLAQHFAMEQWLQESLKRLRPELFDLRLSRSAEPEHGGELPDWDAFKPDQIDLAEEGRTEGALLAADLLGGGLNTLAIIESAGTAAEFWGCRRLSLNQFKTEISNASWASTMAPKSWLIEAVRRLRATSLAEFILSYLVVCEVALFGPLLPQHQQLRKGRINLRELVPFLRWYALLNAASDVPPMTSLGDYERYATAICRALGWTPPKEVVDASVASSPHMPDEPVRAHVLEGPESTQRSARRVSKLSVHNCQIADGIPFSSDCLQRQDCVP